MRAGSADERLAPGAGDRRSYAVSMRCSSCANDFEMPAERCPHCGVVVDPVNVGVARQTENVDKLESRFTNAMDDAAARGCRDVVHDFMKAVEDRASAAICVRVGQVERLARSDKEIYASYYLQREGEHRTADGE